MLTKQQKKVFEELLDTPGFKGREKLRYLLWLNTTEPKYKKGESFLVTDRSRKIFGYQVVNFKATVVKAYTMGEMEYFYEMEMDVTCGSRHTRTTHYTRENVLNNSSRCEDCINVFGEALSEHADVMNV
ncbi:MAG: hypothetical protein II897_04075 [Clostridia bacterium]|nr:hypothetical protein [Clostridia bacterium]